MTSAGSVAAARRPHRLIAASAVAFLLAACSVDLAAEPAAPGSTALNPAAGDGSDRGSGAGPAERVWREGGEFIRDADGYVIYTGDTFARDRDGVAVVIPGDEPAWWFSANTLSGVLEWERWPDVRVAAWQFSFVNDVLGLTANLRLGDEGPHAATLTGRLGWVEGHPVLLGPDLFGDYRSTPRIEFVDSPSGDELRAVMQERP